MKQAFAQPVAATLNDVDMSRRHLRKQESRYSNKNTESILPMAAQGTTNCAELDNFMLIDETNGKEMVGHYVDSRGHPVAEVWESKPPPPDADYKSSAPETSNLKLTRLMGFDPHKEIKKLEIEGVVNPSESMNGDADFSAQRIAQTSELTARSVYFNKKHAQKFADYDSKRGDMYDGFNDKRTPTERVHRLEPTHRNDTGEFREPGLGHQASGKQIHKVTAKRLEISKPWTRDPHKNPSGSFNIPSVASLPILPVTHRNNASDKTPNAHNGAHASFAQSPRIENEDRPVKNTHMITHQTLPDSGGHLAPVILQRGDNSDSQRDNRVNAIPVMGMVPVVSQATVPQVVDVFASEREQQYLSEFPSGIVDVAPGAPIPQTADALEPEREQHLPNPPLGTANVAPQSRIPQIVDTFATEREQHVPKPTVVDSTTWAAMVKHFDTERDTADDAEISNHLRSAHTNTVVNVTSGVVLQAVQVANEDAPPVPFVSNRTNMPVPGTQVAANATVHHRSDVTEGILPTGNNAGGVEHRANHPMSTTYRHGDVETVRTNLAVSQNVTSPLAATSHTTRHGMQLDIVGSGSVQGKGGLVGPSHDLVDGYRQQTPHATAGHSKEESRRIHQSTDALGTEREREGLSLNHGAIETTGLRQGGHHNNISHARQELGEDEGGRGKHASFGASQFLKQVDRIPILSSAIYHIELGSSSTTGVAPRTKELSRVDTNRTRVSESDPARAHSAFEHPSHARDVVPMRAMAGEKFGPDRLSPYHVNDRRKIDATVRSSLSNVPDRSTPVLRTFASTPIQHHRIEQEVSDDTGRDTPSSRLFGRATNLP
tara:strand:+ start:2755 stop:5244 length:2490 start_codon:yes stop_codon:yes gene_type:complete